MNEWGVVGVLIALVTFGIAVVKPIVSLTRTITELTVVVRQLKDDMDVQKENAHDAHRRLWDREKEQDRQLADHELRLGKLEDR